MGFNGVYPNLIDSKSKLIKKYNATISPTGISTMILLGTNDLARSKNDSVVVFTNTSFNNFAVQQTNEPLQIEIRTDAINFS